MNYRASLLKPQAAGYATSRSCFKLSRTLDNSNRIAATTFSLSIAFFASFHKSQKGMLCALAFSKTTQKRREKILCRKFYLFLL